jgi:hypothetical protein
VSETLAESRGIEVEVEGDDSNNESLEGVATIVTPTPKANTRSFFGREGNEVGQLALLVDRPEVQALLSVNKEDERLLDTYSSNDNEGEINLQLSDEYELEGGHDRTMFLSYGYC